MFQLKALSTLLFLTSLLVSVVSFAGPGKNELTELTKKPIAPPFVLPDIKSKLYALSDYQGKVVVINFWASWCPPCVAEMPSLQRAADKLAKHDIALLGIGVGENRSSVKNFLERIPLRFPLLLDTRSEIMQAWSIPSLPTTIVVDPTGRVALLALGEREWDSPEILQQIISLQQSP
jgi:peroxiredoxin